MRSPPNQLDASDRVKIHAQTELDPHMGQGRLGASDSKASEFSRCAFAKSTGLRVQNYSTLRVVHWGSSTPHISPQERHPNLATRGLVRILFHRGVAIATFPIRVQHCLRLAKQLTSPVSKCLRGEPWCRRQPLGLRNDHLSRPLGHPCHSSGLIYSLACKRQFGAMPSIVKTVADSKHSRRVF